MPEENNKFKMIHRFFEEEHLVTKISGEEELVKLLKPPSWHCGGRIPRPLLYSPENEILLTFEMIPVVDIAQAAIAKATSLAKTKLDKHTDIKIVTKFISASGRRGIPQSYIPGLFLIYLEFCEGCDWKLLLPQIIKQKQKALVEVTDEKKLSSNDWPLYMLEPVIRYYKKINTRKAKCEKARLSLRV